MPISFEYKTIFIHIPKTAGESMEMKLGMYGANGIPLQRLWGIHRQNVLQHLTANQIYCSYLTPDIFNSYFKFSFVRNPWDKAVSEYHWYLRFGEHMEFNEWVKTLPIRTQESSHRHILEVGHNIPQYKFIYNDNYQLLVNFIGRFENLEEDFKFVCNSIGIKDFSLPHTNSTAAIQRKHYSTYYNDESKKTIATLYCKDIELFNYKFK